MATPYRDEESALRQRLAALDAQLRDARALPERLRALEEARERLEAERAAVAERLEGLGERFSLEGLRIASPCQADWDAMAGDERVRFCGQCQKNVYNLSGMARDEAEALVQGAEGKLCVRMYRRDDGTVLTSDCPEGVRRKRRRRLAIVAGSGALASVSAFGYLSLTVRMGGLRPTAHATMGEVPVSDVAALGVSAPVEPASVGAGPEEPGTPPTGHVAPRMLLGEAAFEVEPAPKPAAGRPKKGPALMGKPAAPTTKPASGGAKAQLTSK
ncbi:MAG TPA: hypothetical protein VFS43_29150 [Polyangiaceae bacterium]|nr:hypothetical protein [Polyangiaceae bacterium]